MSKIGTAFSKKPVSAYFEIDFETLKKNIKIVILCLKFVEKTIFKFPIALKSEFHNFKLFFQFWSF